METKKLNQFLLSLSEEHIIGGDIDLDFSFLKLELKGIPYKKEISLHIKIEEKFQEIIKKEFKNLEQELSIGKILRFNSHQILFIKRYIPGKKCQKCSFQEEDEEEIGSLDIHSERFETNGTSFEKIKTDFFRKLFKKYIKEIKKWSIEKIEYSNFIENLLFQFPLRDMLTEIRPTFDSVFFKFKFNEFVFITLSFSLSKGEFSFKEEKFFRKIGEKKVEIEELKLLNKEIDFIIKNYNCNKMESLEERIKKRNEEIEEKFKEYVDIYKNFIYANY